MKGVHLVTLLTLLALPGNEGQVRKIWSIAFGHAWGSHEYIDHDGYLKGFGVDLIEKVCMEANMECRVVRDKYSGCWGSNPGDHPSGGRGLFARWYDACTSWMQTIGRTQVFQFTQAHFPTGFFHLYTLKGKTFDTSDLRDKKIGIIEGWVSDEKCLARQANVQYEYSAATTKFFLTPNETFNALQKYEIDAAFTSDSVWNEQQWQTLSKIDTRFNCALGGFAMMSRKDSGFTAAWNVGLSKLKNTNSFTKFCEEANKKHEARGDPMICT